jgi:hypothetical protein
MTAPQSSQIKQDGRNYGGNVDTKQLISWAINLFTGIVLAIGAYYFNNINENVSKLRDDVASLRTQVALLQSTRGEVELLKAQVLAYISVNNEQIKNSAVLSEQLRAIDKRLESLEKKG